MSDVGEPLLQVKGLQTFFRTDDGIVKAVDGVDLEVRPGEVLGIVGESGSGKSVTCLSLMGLIDGPAGFHPGGQVLFKGESILGASDARLRRLRGNRMSMIFQDPMTSLNPYLTVQRQLTEVLELHQGMNRRAAKQRAVEMLELVGIPEAAERISSYPHEFSGGMRQRVMIAMALLCEPELLVADEPTTALDVTIQAQILDLIRHIQQTANTAVILITHDLGVLAGMADRIMVMYAGRVVEAGPTDAVFANPQHPYTWGLLRSVPRLDEAHADKLAAIEGLPPDLSRLPDGCHFAPRCEKATDRCLQDNPPWSERGPGHGVACIHPGREES